MPNQNLNEAKAKTKPPRAKIVNLGLRQIILCLFAQKLEGEKLPPSDTQVY